MTEMLAVRLPREKMARLKAAARKRSVSRSDIIRDLVDRFLEKEVATGKGVGWAEHFEKLFREGRRVKGNPEDEIRQRDRERGFR